MISMGRGTFKAYMYNVIDHLDDASFLGLSQIFLVACGVIDGDGNLTEEYANSPYWELYGEELKPSENARLMNQLSPEIREVIEGMANG